MSATFRVTLLVQLAFALCVLTTAQVNPLCYTGTFINLTAGTNTSVFSPVCGPTQLISLQNLTLSEVTGTGNVFSVILFDPSTTPISYIFPSYSLNVSGNLTSCFTFEPAPNPTQRNFNTAFGLQISCTGTGQCLDYYNAVWGCMTPPPVVSSSSSTGRGSSTGSNAAASAASALTYFAILPVAVAVHMFM